ncbi:MAG: glycosyltransferase family 4 protein [Planctomycetaceae bacterium]|nr:glycosyltransferase family 4 protein [Planctomycetaceae bacterium]
MQRPVKPIESVAFVSTRIAGTDGVSLEIEKWTEVLSRLGVDSYFIAGECDRDEKKTFLIEEAHLNHPQILDIRTRAFGTQVRTEELTNQIIGTSGKIRKKLQQAVERFQPDLLIAENSLSIPMNIPLGIAVLQMIQQTGIDCLAHHHDLPWERERFRINCIDDFLAAAFPPPLRQIHHVVINQIAAENFSRRIGLPTRRIPNVMDFENPPSPPDDYANSFREELGLSEEDHLILQPTRVVARKAIQISIELIRRLNDPRAKLVISHDIGDEGKEYADYLREFAEMMNVEVIFASDRISDRRGRTAEGRKIFTIHDVYPQADLVTYPSEIEGFGNAFLEAIYYRCPIICNRYSIYRTDIEPSGVSPIVFDGFLTDATVDQVRSVLEDSQYASDMVEYNYQAARQYFSYEILEDHLQEALRWISYTPRH